MTLSAPEPSAEDTADAAELAPLLAIMARLRDPESGCPWDVAQDFDSIAPYAIEEAHEVADAIARRAWDELPGELGDLLLQVVYHAQMAAEAGRFGFADVAREIRAKMVARHPHVFGPPEARSAAAHGAEWERMKATERATRGEGGVLDGIALGLPALTRAVKLQKRAARVGFDWPTVGEVVEKITEEAGELAEARDRLGPAEVAEEFGDLMFAMVNLGRHLGVDPEAALRATNAKFTRRFGHIETRLNAMGRSPATSDLEEMEALWQEAKRIERCGS